SLTTVLSATAVATAPLVIAITIAGFVFGRREIRRPDAWAVAASLGVFAIYAAPIVLTGTATFAGYGTNDDTSTWIALADNTLAHGRPLVGPASTYGATVNGYYTTGYPLGSFMPLGLGHVLTRENSLWLFQPTIAVIAALLGLIIYELTS